MTQAPKEKAKKKAEIGGKKVKPKAESSFGRHKPELQLLQSIDGVFAPGVMTALMGSTGAGKTTLMDVLAGRKTGTFSLLPVIIGRPCTLEVESPSFMQSNQKMKSTKWQQAVGLCQRPLAS